MSDDQSRSFLTFRIGNEDYAIDILKVREIREVERVTHIAGAPEYVNGIINLRGVIVPIVDLRARFGFDKLAECGTRVVIILSIDERPLGVVVDAVSDVATLDLKDIRKPPEQIAAVISEAFVRALAIVDDRMLIIVDLAEVIVRERFEELAA